MKTATTSEAAPAPASPMAGMPNHPCIRTRSQMKLRGTAATITMTTTLLPPKAGKMLRDRATIVITA